jgi:hypothetical protein
MWRALILIFLLPIVAAAAARWYFGLRILAAEGGRPCRRDLSRWPAQGELQATPPRAEESAHELGNSLRQLALDAWQKQDPKAAASRAGSKRFGMAVPPLSAMVAIFAVLVAKIPIAGAIAILLGSTAISCVTGILSLTPELAAITRAAKLLRESRTFARRDDEDAVIRCAAAHAWKDTLPPIVSLIQR